MRINEILLEGGWDSVVTQNTTITPAVVPKILNVAHRFVNEFNAYAAKKNWPAIIVGRPTGSGSHWQTDLKVNPATTYGDVDLQIEVPLLDEYRNAPYSQLQNYWYAKWLEFIEQTKPPYIHADTFKKDEKGKSRFGGHLIIDISDRTDGSLYSQVDLMPHANPVWGRARVTPERGIKGLLHGNMFSVLGLLLDYSIQHAGVQYKEREGQRVNFTTTRSNYALKTLSDNPQTFLRDVFMHDFRSMYGAKEPKMDPLLRKHPGVSASIEKDPSSAKIADLVAGIYGLARSFDMNKMFGQGHLSRYQNAKDFLDKFWKEYEAKAQNDIASSKRDKAQSQTAMDKAEADRNKIRVGLEKVRAIWNSFQ